MNVNTSLLSTMSDVRLKSEFQVGAGDYTTKNQGVHMTPQQVKKEMIQSREYFFITPGQVNSRLQLFQKTGLEKMQIRAAKKKAQFKNKLVFTNKF